MLYRSIFTLFFFISIISPIFAEEGIDPFASSSLASTEGVISSIVAGHVSVISGDFLIHEEDLVIPGPSPLRLQRNYCSSDPYAIYFHKSWNLAEPAILAYSQTSRKGTAYALVTTPHGARAYYETSLKGKPKGNIPFSFTPTKGYTNCGSGRISGQTNIRNNILHLDNQDEDGNFSGNLVSGDGTTQDYQIYRTDYVNNLAGFRIYRETKQDRTKKYFQYDSNEDISQIQQFNWYHSVLYGTLSFKWHSKRELEIQSSTGKAVTYHFGKKKNSYYLNKVVNPEKPDVNYVYETSSNNSDHSIITEKILPKGRGLKVVYNDIDRVEEIQAPIGENGTFRTAYRFEYVCNHPHNGATHVYDAYDRKTTYDYDSEERLKQVVHINRSGALHSIESYFFEGKGHPQEGNLIARYLRDSSHNPVKGKTFYYDDKGNITRSNTYGAITGKNYLPIVLGENGIPSNNGTEYYGKTFEYGENNVVTLEKEDNGKEIRYTYYPNSNGITSKLLMNGSGEIIAREFYVLDDNLFVWKKTVDDGNTTDPESLSGVSYRKLTYCRPRTIAPIGLIDQVDEKYLDMETLCEKRLSRHVNHHSIEGRLIQQDHYDSNDNFRYSLYWEYDAHGNLTKEVNASKEATIREYDANDNLTFEKNLAQGIERHITYDHVNRPTIIEERHPDGIVFIEETTYDLVGNIISKKDSRGNVTDYTYNDQNRLISIQYPEVMYEGKLVRPQEHFEYDVLGNKVLHRDKSGYATKTVCNAKGSPLLITYPDGTSEQFEYYPNGDLQKAVHKNGSYTFYIRDCLGRTTSEQEFTIGGTPLSEKTFVYKGTHLIAETDPEGITTHYTYDGAGRLIKRQTEEKRQPLLMTFADVSVHKPTGSPILNQEQLPMNITAKI